MTEEIRNTLTEEVKKLIAAPSACPEAKAACEKWLAAAGKALFGEERAAAILAHAKDIKEKGARFCDCPACSACAEIIGTLK